MSQVHEEDNFDEQQDWRYFSHVNEDGTLPKRGDKEFEPDGTKIQIKSIEESRDIMYNALKTERKIAGRGHVIGIWYEFIDETFSNFNGINLINDKKIRVVSAHGSHFKTIGKADSKGKVWLEPEEALYLLERGSLECWWIEKFNKDNLENEDKLLSNEEWDKINGFPMSLEGAYSALIKHCGGLERFLIYSNLKRSGYIVQRSCSFSNKDMGLSFNPNKNNSIKIWNLGLMWNLWEKIFCSKHGSIVLKNSYYKSINDAYKELRIIPCQEFSKKEISKNESNMNKNKDTNEEMWKYTKYPFRIAFYAWKPKKAFKKSHPGPPDFKIVVIDARKENMPTLNQLSLLFDTIPMTVPKGVDISHRIKTGYRNVLFAIVDSGVTTFIRFTDTSFANEPVLHKTPKSKQWF